MKVALENGYLTVSAVKESEDEKESGKMSIYTPVDIMVEFDAWRLLKVAGYTVLLSAAAVFTFYRGLRRYSSGNTVNRRNRKNRRTLKQKIQTTISP